MHEALDVRLLRGEDEAAGALGHDPLELLFLSLSDRDQVDDALDALDRAFQGGRLGHVALHELAAQRREALGTTGVADEAPHGPVGLAQRPHDVAAHESRSAGDEDHLRSCTRTPGRGSAGWRSLPVSEPAGLCARRRAPPPSPRRAG